MDDWFVLESVYNGFYENFGIFECEKKIYRINSNKICVENFWLFMQLMYIVDIL